MKLLRWLPVAKNSWINYDQLEGESFYPLIRTFFFTITSGQLTLRIGHSFERRTNRCNSQIWQSTGDSFLKHSKWQIPYLPFSLLLPCSGCFSIVKQETNIRKNYFRGRKRWLIGSKSMFVIAKLKKKIRKSIVEFYITIFKPTTVSMKRLQYSEGCFKDTAKYMHCWSTSEADICDKYSIVQ